MNITCYAMEKTDYCGAKYYIDGSTKFYISYVFNTISNRELRCKGW